MDGADCMARNAQGLCLDCMDGADCRKAPGCPGELDGAHSASKLHSSTTKKCPYNRPKLFTNQLPGRQTNGDKPTAWTTNIPTTVAASQTVRIRPKRQWLHRKLLASPSDGALMSYLPPPQQKKHTISHKLLLDEGRIHVLTKWNAQTARTSSPRGEI